MNDQFKVGTICIGQNYTYSTHRNELECEVIGGLQMRACLVLTSGKPDRFLGYLVRWADGEVWVVLPHQIRRKPPKQSDSQWADEAIRKLKKQSSDHVAIGKPELIPEESTQ